MNISKRLLSLSLGLAIMALAATTIARTAQADSSLLSTQEGATDISNVYGGNNQDIRVTIAEIINIVLEFIGLIFFVLIIFAGFQYMTSGGNEEKTKQAVRLLRNAIIGFVIILMAWGVTRFTIWTFSRAAGNYSDYMSYPH